MNMDLDAGDFDAVIPSTGTSHNSQQGNGAMIPSKGKEEAGEPQTIKTSLKALRDKEAVDWEAIEAAAISGVTYPQLEKQFGISQGRIRTMACRKQWPTPGRAMAQAEAKLREAQAELHRVKLRRAGRSEEAEGVTAETMPLIEAARREKVAATITDSMDEMSSTGLMASMQRAFRSVLRAPEFLPVESLQDLTAATKLLKYCAGLDSPQVAVNLGLFSSQSPAPESLGVAIDLETGEE